MGKKLHKKQSFCFKFWIISHHQRFKREKCIRHLCFNLENFHHLFFLLLAKSLKYIYIDNVSRPLDLLYIQFPSSPV